MPANPVDDPRAYFGSLKPLEKGLFILQKIDGGAQPEELAYIWGDDAAAGRGHLLFLTEMKWLAISSGGLYIVTTEGKTALEKYSESLSVLFKKDKVKKESVEQL
jgi:hypothetical protein